MRAIPVEEEKPRCQHEDRRDIVGKPDWQWCQGCYEWVKR